MFNFLEILSRVQSSIWRKFHANWTLTKVELVYQKFKFYAFLVKGHCALWSSCSVNPLQFPLFPPILKRPQVDCECFKGKLGRCSYFHTTNCDIDRDKIGIMTCWILYEFLHLHWLVGKCLILDKETLYKER